MVTTAATNAPYAGQPDERADETRTCRWCQPINAASLAAAKTVTHGAVPIELSAGVHSIKSSVVARDVAVCTAPGSFFSADLALQDTGAL